jgi:hypothetical protein
MVEDCEQTTGDVTPDPGGYLAIALLVIVVTIVTLFAMALIVSA